MFTIDPERILKNKYSHNGRWCWYYKDDDEYDDYVEKNEWHSNEKKDNRKKEDNMSVTGNYNVVMVNFVNGTNCATKYSFACFDHDIDIGDHVLCDTSRGYHVAKVVDIVPQNEYNGVSVTKEVVCKVDFTEFNKREEMRKRRANLKKQMDKMVEDNKELVLYQAIAEKNPEMAKMLEAYKELSGV